MTLKEQFQNKLSSLSLPASTKLLIVSKTRPVSDIKTYYELGHRDFGENRVQELQEKAELLKVECPDIRWHMIGHLQTNKVNTLYKISHLHAIHSVHDQHLLEALIKAEAKLEHPVKIFLQLNTSHEEEKSGFENYQELRAAAELLKSTQKLKLAGLMTMGTLRTEAFEAEARRCFQELNKQKSQLESELKVSLESSMGMSQDYRIAIEEKSHWVRLGTMMFH